MPISAFILITGNFNCRNPNWYLGDPITPQGARVEALTSFYGLNQLIKIPTHLLQNSASFQVSSFHQEINYLKTIWQKNSFPLFFIDKCVQNILTKLFIKRNHKNLTSAKKKVLKTLQEVFDYLGKTKKCFSF